MIFFYYDSSFYNIEAQVSSEAGLTTTVLIARDRVLLDYGLGKNAETADVGVLDPSRPEG